MELWDDISKKVGDAASVVGKSAEKFTDLAKLKYNITISQGKLEKIFESIGKFHYEEYKNKIDNTEVINKLLIDADNLSDEIADLRAKMDEQRRKRCNICGAKISKNNSFCPSCGAKQSDSDDTEKAENTED